MLKRHFFKLLFFFLLGYLLLNFPTYIRLEDDYIVCLDSLKSNNKTLQNQYYFAITKSQKEELIQHTTEHLLHLITKDLPTFWYGTPWDYSGTTQVPNEGHIACGYYVSTILRDAGFEVERRKLAQQASEKIVKTLVSEKYIKRFSRKKIKVFLEEMEKLGDGLYVVGLDTHVGFLWIKDGKKRFIHSARTTRGVVNENAWRSKVLIRSKYRIVGRLLPNDEVVEKWLAGESFKVK
ncbi:MAG: hypothetical protein ACPG5B_16845 [Chitinophagales bacterium]